MFGSHVHVRCVLTVDFAFKWTLSVGDMTNKHKHNSGSIGRIAKIYAPVDSAYAMSSAVLKMAILGDLYDLERLSGNFSYQ